MKRYSQEQIEELAQILKNDGVISVPTDTIYGLCACMDSKKACEKVMKIKKRPHSQTFAIMCANKDQIRKIAIIDEREEKIIDNFMPGPITLILKKRPEISVIQECVKNDTIGIRMASSKSLENLIARLGKPICLTSANKSGEPVCSSIDEIEKVFPELDGIMEGRVLLKEGSTIVDCTSKELKILRQGPISLEQIKEVL